MSLPRQVTQRTLPLPGSHTPLEPRSYKKSGYPEAALPENPGREREDARGVPTAPASSDQVLPAQETEASEDSPTTVYQNGMRPTRPTHVSRCRIPDRQKM